MVWSTSSTALMMQMGHGSGTSAPASPIATPNATPGSPTETDAIRVTPTSTASLLLTSPTSTNDAEGAAGEASKAPEVVMLVNPIMEMLQESFRGSNSALVRDW